MALTMLISAIQLADNPASSDIPTSSASASLSPQSSTGSVSSSKVFAGIIAGSVVCGLTLLAALIVGALFLCKRHRQRNDSPLVVDGSSPMLTPFTTTQNMTSSGILGEQHLRNQVKSARFPAVAMRREPSPSGAAEIGSSGIVGVDVQTEPTTAPGNQVGITDNPSPGSRREYTLMEELLRSLNDRMSRDRWNAEEMPPGYYEG
ncbi:hypothetical protein EV421DRAFT_1915389 [Armillaria borealis]|uniref:Mid2 domain-containing protein n=1 Tax=Armillaria borealis TaxID=47425 RepID=A0AA39IDX2_9AGAR|nr:hypothetical protein EV421DRAFT_1915389 [Armillaria borealis]